MGVNAAQHLMNQAPFRSTFPILVIAKIFDGVYDNSEEFRILNFLILYSESLHVLIILRVTKIS